MATANPHASTPRRRWSGTVPVVVSAVVALLGSLVGCSTEPTLRKPERHSAPYAAVIAVAPLANDSGVTIDPRSRAEVSDDIVAALNRVEGWAAVPLDRTLGAMAQLGMAEVRTESDARELIATIGVDAIVVGTITEWNPSDPPRFGTNILLIGDRDRLRSSMSAQALYGRTGDDEAEPVTADDGVATVSDLVIDLDSVDHGTRQLLRDYAAARIDVTGGFDPPERYYLMVFHRYLQFCADRIASGLVQREAGRLQSGN